MTKQEAISNFRKMWKWIALETMKQKRIINKDEYFIEHDLEDIYFDCYCCEYSNNKREKHNQQLCINCPISFPSKCKEFMCCDNKSIDDGLFNQWLEISFEQFYKESALLAYKISKLPERKLKGE